MVEEDGYSCLFLLAGQIFLQLALDHHEAAAIVSIQRRGIAF